MCVFLLSHSDLPTDLKGSSSSYAIETAKLTDRSIVVDRDSAKGVAGLDGIPAHRLSFRILLLVLLVVLHLVLEVLLIVAIDAEVLLLEYEEPVTEFALLEVDKPLRIECISLVSGLKMKMRTSRTS